MKINIKTTNMKIKSKNKEGFAPTSNREIIEKLDEMIRAFNTLSNHSYTDIYVKYAIEEAMENLIVIKSFLKDKDK